jgi:hypothetical protein
MSKMTRKPEATFRDAVDRHLPATVHRQGGATTFSNGTPDRYYEGRGGVLWAEYKYAPKLPKVLDLVHGTSTPKLSALQARWLRRAAGNGVAVCVVLGWPEGGVILPGTEWSYLLPADRLREKMLTKREIAVEIARLVGELPTDETA